jgi:hypothetical protein
MALVARRIETSDREAIPCHRLEVLPKRWIVERSSAWISRNRRLARDFERYAATESTIARVVGRRQMVTTLTSLAAGQATFSGKLIPYQSGGCGFCTGSRIMGTFLN